MKLYRADTMQGIMLALLTGKQPPIHTAHVPIFKSPLKCSNIEQSAKCRLDMSASYS